MFLCSICMESIPTDKARQGFWAVTYITPSAFARALFRLHTTSTVSYHGTFQPLRTTVLWLCSITRISRFTKKSTVIPLLWKLRFYLRQNTLMLILNSSTWTLNRKCLHEIEKKYKFEWMRSVQANPMGELYENNVIAYSLAVYCSLFLVK